jgi:hypothetical protein
MPQNRLGRSVVRVETIGAGSVTVALILFEIYLLFDAPLAAGLGASIGVSGPTFEWIVFFASIVILGIVWWAAENAETPF